MIDSLFNPMDQLILLAGRSPLILILAAGLVVCHQQRNRRPRAARLFAIALSIELVLNMIGWEIYAYVANWLGMTFATINNNPPGVEWMVRMILFYLPASIVVAVTWSFALWSILMVDDFRSTQVDDAKADQK